MQKRVTRTVRLFALVPVAIAAMGACSGDDPVVNVPGLRIVSGGTGADTIEARLPQPLILELRDESLQPLANRLLRFLVDGLPTADSADYRQSMTLSGSTITQPGSALYTGTTDANGRLQVDVRLGQVVGVATMTIVAPGANSTTPQLLAHASYQTRPGKPARVSLAPRDTALYPSARLVLRQTVRDRFQFVTTGTIAAIFTSTSGVTAASSGIVTARIPGRDTIIARVGTFADTVRVITLPTTGVLAANFAYNNDVTKSGIAVMNLDGSNYREYAKGLSPIQPRFTYDMQSLIVQITTQADERLWVLPLDGSAPRRLVPSTTTFSEAWPAPSADGQFIYFCSLITERGWPSLHRVKTNGTSVQRLPVPTPDLNDDLCSQPSISADGQYVAWPVPGDGRLKTRLLATGARTAFNREGYSPQFARTGTRIAYIKGNPGPLYSADVDGTNDRLVSSGFYQGPLSWSVDGKYILAYRGAQFAPGSYYELIEEATGKTFPLPFKLGFYGVLRPN